MKTNYANVPMLEMIFENRNKAYGAYVLRRDYNQSLSRAVAITFSTVFFICALNYIREHLHHHHQIDLHDVIASTTNIPNLIKKDEVKPEVRRDPLKPKPTIKDPELNVVPQAQAQADSLPDQQTLSQFDPGLTTTRDVSNGSPIGVEGGKGTGDVTDPGPTIPPHATEPTRLPDVMPEFPGGERALMKFLADHTEYPEREKDLDIGGRVVTEFTVDEQGSVSDIKVVRSPSPGFNKSVVSVCKMLPAFKPGLQNGHPVKVRYVLPFTFTTTR